MDQTTSNISKRSNLITIYLINYFLHNDHYNFCDAEKTVKDFIIAVENNFVSKGKVKVQGSMELISYQPEGKTDQITELKSRRIWVTDIFSCVYFYAYIHREIRKSFMKRVIINGLTGRFERLSIIVTSSNSGSVLA